MKTEQIKLSDYLLAFRIDRPSEWQMDSFIARAKELEAQLLATINAHNLQNRKPDFYGINDDGTIVDVSDNAETAKKTLESLLKHGYSYPLFITEFYTSPPLSDEMNELKINFDVLVNLMASHSKLAEAEYQRNGKYNNQHYSHEAEMALISYLQKQGYFDKVMQALSQKDKS